MTLNIDALLERAGLSGRQSIALNLIIANPDNPRRDFDLEELEALAASIRERGLLQPVSLFPPDAAGFHVLRFGERRVRAARMAGLTEISAFICEPPARAVQLIDQIIENDQRVGLSPLDMSRAIAALSDAGMTKAAIAGQLGRAPSMISLYAAVVEMPDRLQAIADRVTIRSLHDLYREWRRDPQAVDAFLDATPVESINRRTVLALGDGPAPGPVRTTGTDRMPSGRDRQDGRAGAAAPLAAQATPPAPRACGRAGQVRVRCEAGEGALLFPAQWREGRVMILLDGSEQPREMTATGVTILSVGPID